MAHRILFKRKSQNEVEKQIQSGSDFNWYYKALFMLFSSNEYTSFSIPCRNEALSLHIYRNMIKAIDTIMDFCGGGSITVNQDPYKVEVVKSVPRKLRKEIRSRRKSRDNSAYTNT